MGKRVLDVGNCAYDHAAIRRLLEERFGAEVAWAADGAEALRRLEEGSFDLVLVNRVLDGDGGDGVELIRRIKSEPGRSGLPVMLVSDYAEWQGRAAEAGAVPGFGKSRLGDPETLERLRRWLA